MTINLSEVIKNQLRAHKVNIPELIQEFSDAVSYNPSFIFGRNKRNSGSSAVYHIHFMPDMSDPRREDWEEKYRTKKSSDSRTSDNFIFYTVDNSNNYTLLAMVKPGGHGQLSNKKFIAQIEKMASLVNSQK